MTSPADGPHRSSTVAPGVPLRTRVLYAAPALALAVVGIPVYVHLPKFYTDVVGVPVAWLGALVFLSRVLDAGTDPVIGILSDRTFTRWGRRRPFIALASVPLALSLVALLAPPRGLDGSAATLWFGVAMAAVFLAWTLVVVPYEALGPELTFDYDERTSVLGLRDGALLAGTLLAAASPLLVSRVLGLPATDDGERAKFLWMGLLYAPLLLVLCQACVAGVRERAPGRGGGGLPDLRSLRSLLRNRPFAILLGSYVISALGSNLPGALLLYYVEYVLQSDAADLFLVEYLATGILLLPAWIALSRRLGKKRAWILSMLVNTGAFVGVFFLGPGDEAAYAVLVFLSGIGLGATLAIPSSLQADVIDYDELRTGERREGLYIGVWSVSRKAAAAVGVGIALPILGLAGYVPNVEQNPQVVLTLRVLYALVPSVCNLAAIALATRYPIERDDQRAILEAIERRRRGLEVSDPLLGGPIGVPAR